MMKWRLRDVETWGVTYRKPDRRTLLAMAGAISIAPLSMAMAQDASGLEEPDAALVTAQEHFAGKTLRILIAAAAGSGTDRSARQFVGTLRQLLPESRLQVENNDRAAGQVAASEMWRAAADGTVVGFPRSNLFYAELMERATLDFSFTGFTFLGSITRGNRVLVLRNDSLFSGIDDILAGDRIVLKSANSVNSSHYYEALLVNALTGSRIRPVPGYAGGARNMAVISGEVDCQIGTIEAVQPILAAGAGRIVFRLTSGPLPEGFPEVPRLADHLRDPGLGWVVGVIDAGAKLGRPFAGPPGMDPVARAHWETLFDRVVRDSAFRAGALAEEGLVIDPAPAAEIEALLAGLAALGDDLRDKIDVLLDCGQRLADSTENACG